jgi:hypothetical protein
MFEEKFRPEQWVAANADSGTCKVLGKNTFLLAIKNSSAFKGNRFKRKRLTTILKNKNRDHFRKGGLCY